MGRRVDRPHVLLAGLVLLTVSCSANRGVVPGASTGISPTSYSALPASALGTQRLLRAQVRGPEGEASLRIVLRLAAADRYEIDTTDIAGRPVWSLRVDGSRGLLLDSRNHRYCLLADSVSLPGGLGLSLPLNGVPRLLLGRLPVEAPPGASEVRQGEDRRWTWTGLDGQLQQWMLWESGQPSVWYLRGNGGRGSSGEKGESVLSIRSRATQLRWREDLVEPFDDARFPLHALVPPHDFEEGACNADDVS